MIDQINNHHNNNNKPNSKLDFVDVTQAVTWDKSDYDKIQKEFELIRHYSRRVYPKSKELKPLIEKVDDRIERFKNDQTIREGPRPITITEKQDLITAAGRSRAAELITGYSFQTFDNMAVGTSQIPPQDSDYKLYEEIGRVSSQQTGFVSPSGSVIKHVATFSPSFPSGTYWEIAPVDLAVESDDQSIFARVVFTADRPAVHVASEDFFTIHHSTFTSSTT